MIAPFSPTARRRLLTCLALAGGLSACAINHTPRVTATGFGLAAGSQVKMTDTARAGADERAISVAVEDALARHSITLSDNGPIEIDFSLGLRPSSVGIARVANGDVDWESPARRNYLLDRCPGERARVTMVAFERATGSVRYRSTAEADSCETSPEAFARLAEQLVARAIAGNSSVSP